MASIQHSVGETVWNDWVREYDTVCEHFEANRLQECLDRCDELLSEESMPRYIRIKVLILVAFVVEDQDGFRKARLEAQSLWTMSSGFYFVGTDEDAERSFNEVQDTLNDLRDMEKQEWMRSDEELAADDEAALTAMQWRFLEASACEEAID